MRPTGEVFNSFFPQRFDLHQHRPAFGGAGFVDHERIDNGQLQRLCIADQNASGRGLLLS